MATRTPLTPKTEPVGPDGLTLRERSWRNEAAKHVQALNVLLAERGCSLRFTFPAPIAGVLDAPLPDQAYAGGRPVLDELADVLQVMTATLQLAKAGHNVPVPDERLMLLKRAAVTDRLALAAPADVHAQRTAMREALALLVFDGAHDTERGPLSPDSPEWDAAGGPRAYVRQEYQAWWTTPLAPGEGI
jgi:hypothetical protein